MGHKGYFGIHENALTLRHEFQIFIALALLGLFGAVPSLGQTSPQEFRRFLQDEAAFTNDDFSALERGGMVVKLLPVKDKREVAVCGLVRMAAPAAISLQAFQESMRQRSLKSLMEIGKFGIPPSVDDVQALTLEDRDVEDLKACVVGRCKLKMSASMIERFRKDVDWLAGDYRIKASRLFRQILHEYVQDYLARGDAALLEYQDQARGVQLKEEQRSLLESSLYINNFAPELTEYVQNFPQSKLEGVENAINWTKVNFGLKPVTIITHVATYTRQFNGAPQVLVVTKQIYANHYFDSSLALTALISVPANASTYETYLLYTNRSRADSLAGSFSKLKRTLVQDEAVANLNTVLIQTLQNLENRAMIESASTQGPVYQKIVAGLFGGTRFVWWLITMAVLTAVFALRKKKSKHNVTGFE